MSYASVKLTQGINSHGRYSGLIANCKHTAVPRTAPNRELYCPETVESLKHLDLEYAKFFLANFISLAVFKSSNYCWNFNISCVMCPSLPFSVAEHLYLVEPFLTFRVEPWHGGLISHFFYF